MAAINPIMALVAGLGSGAVGLSEGIRDDQEREAKAAQQRAQEAERQRQAKRDQIDDALKQVALAKTIGENFTPVTATTAPTPPPATAPSLPSTAGVGRTPSGGPADAQRAAQTTVQQTFAKAAAAPSSEPEPPTVMLPDPVTGKPMAFRPKGKIDPVAQRYARLIAYGVPEKEAQAASLTDEAFNAYVRPKTPAPPRNIDPNSKEARAAALEDYKARRDYDIAHPMPTAGSGFQAISAASQLRGQFDNDPIVKNAKAIAESVGGVRAAAKDPSAAGDLSLIYQTMKAYDPASSVREGEFATAQNAASVPERVRNQWNRLLKGERLSPEQRADFVHSVEAQARSQAALVNKAIDRYSEIAQRNGLDLRDVVFDPFEGYSLEQPAAPSITPEERAALRARGFTDEQINAKYGTP